MNRKYFAMLSWEGELSIYQTRISSKNFIKKHKLWSSASETNVTLPVNTAPARSDTRHRPNMIMQADNNLIIFDGSERILWSSRTRDKGVAGAHCILLNDGHLTVIDDSGSYLWSSSKAVSSLKHEYHKTIKSTGATLVISAVLLFIILMLSCIIIKMCCKSSPRLSEQVEGGPGQVLGARNHDSSAHVFDTRSGSKRVTAEGLLPMQQLMSTEGIRGRVRDRNQEVRVTV